MATSLTTGASDITDSLPVVKLLGKAAVTVLRPSTAVVDGKHRCCCAETGGGGPLLPTAILKLSGRMP